MFPRDSQNAGKTAKTVSPFKSVTTTATLDIDDCLVRVTTSGSDYTITLPSVVEAAGLMYSISMASFTAGDVVTIADGGEDAQFVNVLLGSGHRAVVLFSDGMRWIKIGDTGEVKMKAVTLTSAQVKALKASPLEIIAAPGANKLIVFESAMLELHYGGNNGFTESGYNLVFEYDDGDAMVASEVVECTNFINKTADTITNCMKVKDTIDASADIVNKNLVLFNNGGNEIAGNAAGDNTLTVYVYYRILDVS